MKLKLIEDKKHASKVEAASQGIMTETQTFKTDNGLSIIKSVDMGGRFGPTLHISCARQNRKPSWEEVDALKKLFFREEGEAMILLSPKSNPIGFHPYCVHLWQLPESWRENG